MWMPQSSVNSPLLDAATRRDSHSRKSSSLSQARNISGTPLQASRKANCFFTSLTIWTSALRRTYSWVCDDPGDLKIKMREEGRWHRQLTYNIWQGTKTDSMLRNILCFQATDHHGNCWQSFKSNWKFDLKINSAGPSSSFPNCKLHSIRSPCCWNSLHEGKEAPL